MKRLLIFISLLYLAGCGFKLRGDMPLAPPLQNVYVQTRDPYGELAKELSQYLKMSGARLASTPHEASTILVLLNEQKSEQLQSVSGTQQTRQYNLVLTVNFEITNPKGEVLVEPQTVSETRPLTIESNQVLGGSNESENLYRQMRSNIVFDIMNRLSSQEITTLLNKQAPSRHR